MTRRMWTMTASGAMLGKAQPAPDIAAAIANAGHVARKAGQYKLAAALTAIASCDPEALDVNLNVQDAGVLVTIKAPVIVKQQPEAEPEPEEESDPSMKLARRKP